jgi:vacuolar-type H+-ATPase subunit E/Vma4
MATNEEPAGVLREEIIAEGRKQSEGILERTRQQADDILATATAEADKVREEQLERGRTEAARRRELILATVLVEAGRLRVARVESLLESVNEKARGRLLAHDGFKYREAVVTLAALAVSRMEGVAFVVRVSEADRALLDDELAQEITRRVGRSSLNLTVTYDSEITARSGVIVEDAEGRQMWDNRLLKRLERMWPEMRRQIAVETSLVPRSESGGHRP